MPRYSVIVTRDTTESTVVEIDADSPEKAEELAISYSQDNLNIEWTPDYTPNASSDPYTNGAEKIE